MKRFDARTQQWKGNLGNSLSWGLLALFMVVYALEMSHQAVLRYDTFKATAFDLGNMDQVLWNTLHGRLFQFTNQAIDWYGPPTRLAVHFEPIILPLSLLYIFGADPRILLVFQTLVLVTGAVPVFLLTRKYLPQWPMFAAIMVFAYLLSPALLGLNIFDFHPVSLATPLLLYAILALEYKRYVWFVIACVLAGACKEDIPLALAMLGILLIWKYKLRRLGVIFFVGGLLWSFLAFAVIIPHFYPGAQSNNFWYRYETLGSSPGAAIANLILHPWLFFATFITMDRVYYLAGLFRSTGFLPLLAPEWLLPALPSLAVNLLSTDPLLYSGAYHYNAAIIPFVMLAAIHGTRRLMLTWYGWRGERQEETLPAAQDDHDHGGANQGYTRNRNTTRRGRFIAPERRLKDSWQRGFASTASQSANREERTADLSALVPALDAPALHTHAPIMAVALDRTFALATTFKHIGVSIQALLNRLTFPAWRKVQWRHFSERMIPLAKKISVSRLQWVILSWIMVMALVNFFMAATLLNGFWADHEPGGREQHIQQLLAMIPPDASVSAGENLNPHLSERQLLAVFPSVCLDTHCNKTVQYVIVDLNSVFPEDRVQTTSKLNQLVTSGQFRVLARAEGVVLLIATQHT